jgi:creatinine amidohydrolase
MKKIPSRQNGGKSMSDRVRYAELTPQQFRERLAAAPIAYLPLGTLEWHGEHLPLGSDGLQSQGFLEQLAHEVGGIVLPMLFLGPDRVQEIDGQELYGMDICQSRLPYQQYKSQQLAGSAYWVPDEMFQILLEAILKQLGRAGFRIVVGHGHGPSTSSFQAHADQWRTQYGLECLVCWGSKYDREGLGIQVDHAAMNETSLMMALHPDLVRMESLPPDLDQWPVAVGGRDPRVHASPELGRKALALQTERMAGILREMLAQL